MALRAGVTGGVMGTVALTTAASSWAADADQQAHTVEMPALSGDLAKGATQAADSMEATAQQYELQDAQQKAFESAQKQAKENKEKAEAKARAEAQRKAEAAKAKKEAAQERASRSSDRTPLSGVGDAVQNVGDSVGGGSGNSSSLVGFLKAQVGKAYVSGATGPSAYDCSGLTQAAFKQVGVDLPRVSQDQSTQGTDVSLDNLQEGDLLYWGGKGSAYHVGVYIGGGKFIGAQNSSTGVVEKDLDYDPPSGAVRVL